MPDLNLLTTPLIHVERADGRVATLDLAQVYAAAVADDIAGFPHLRPHQRHAWHALLTQIGALALHGAGRADPPADAETWRALLRGLTADHPDDEPWSLIVEDPAKPAFLQAPDPGGLKDFKETVATPDDLDILITARNHDIKDAQIHTAAADDWLFALTTLQTMQGFLGAGNYGISRMNGGFSSRPCMALVPPGGPGARLARDIAVLLETRPGLLEAYADVGYPERGGLGLVWLAPWDGATSLPMAALDPFYVEICRRIRLLRAPDGRVVVRRATSKCARLDAKALNGRTGDPWTPVNRKDGKSLSLSEGGFPYKRLSAYLFGSDWSLPAAMTPRPPDKAAETMWILAEGLVRGSGKTEGYYERRIPTSPVIGRSLLDPDRRGAIKAVADARIQHVAEVAKILRFAIGVAVAGAPSDADGRLDAQAVGKEDRARADPWSDRLEAEVDRGFFPDLWAAVEAPDDVRPRMTDDWVMGVIATARHLFADAIKAIPDKAGGGYRARVRAAAAFEGGVRRQFAALFASPTEEANP